MSEYQNCKSMSKVSQSAIHRAAWTSQKAYLLSSVAVAAGLGNIWRFPYMAGENGGGSFLLAYVVCVVFFGLSLYVLETTAGMIAKKGAVGVFGSLNPHWGPWFGRFLILMLTVVMSYYLVITGWTLGYAVDAITFDLKKFEVFTSGYASLWWLIVLAVLIFAVLIKGLKGLERISKILVPLLVLILVGLAVYFQALAGAQEARNFYFGFKANELLNPTLWRMAVSQAFYSLVIGQGILFAYGSYTPKSFNRLASSSVIVASNSAISIIAGLVIFPIVFTFNIQPDTGSQLSFVAFPEVIGNLAGGKIIAIGFYSLLFIAAFTSCVGSISAIKGTLHEHIKISEAKAAGIVVAVTTLLGIPSALSFTPLNLSISGIPVLDWVDKITGSGIIIFTGIVGAALISWMIKKDILLKGINSPDLKIGSLTISPVWVIFIGRFLPIIFVALIGVTLFI